MKQSKTLIDMLAEIQHAVEAPLYDDLTPYFQGIRDMINFLNDREYASSIEVYEHIINEYKRIYNKHGELK